MKKISVFKCTLMLAELLFFLSDVNFCQYVFFLFVCVCVCSLAVLFFKMCSLHNKYRGKGTNDEIRLTE